EVRCIEYTSVDSIVSSDHSPVRAVLSVFLPLPHLDPSLPLYPSRTSNEERALPPFPRLPDEATSPRASPRASPRTSLPRSSPRLFGFKLSVRSKPRPRQEERPTALPLPSHPSACGRLSLGRYSFPSTGHLAAVAHWARRGSNGLPRGRVELQLCLSSLVVYLCPKACSGRPRGKWRRREEWPENEAASLWRRETAESVGEMSVGTADSSPDCSRESSVRSNLPPMGGSFSKQLWSRVRLPVDMKPLGSCRSRLLPRSDLVSCVRRLQALRTLRCSVAGRMREWTAEAHSCTPRQRLAVGDKLRAGLFGLHFVNATGGSRGERQSSSGIAASLEEVPTDTRLSLDAELASNLEQMEKLWQASSTLRGT
ncbi:MAG: hypothetical protein SGPRY_011868, partial [Prymnesium sp.]